MYSAYHGGWHVFYYEEHFITARTGTEHAIHTHLPAKLSKTAIFFASWLLVLCLVVDSSIWLKSKWWRSVQRHPCISFRIAKWRAPKKSVDVEKKKCQWEQRQKQEYLNFKSIWYVWLKWNMVRNRHTMDVCVCVRASDVGGMKMKMWQPNHQSTDAWMIWQLEYAEMY